MSSTARALAFASGAALAVCSVLLFVKSGEPLGLPAHLKSGRGFLETVHRFIHIGMGGVAGLAAALALVSSLLGRKREEAGSIAALAAGGLGLIALGIYLYLLFAFQGRPFHAGSIACGIALLLLLAAGVVRMYVVTTTPGH